MSASPEGDVSPKLERSSPAQAPISPHQRAMAALEQRVNVGSRSILLAVRLTLTQYDYTMQSITSKRGVLRGDTRRPAEVTQGCVTMAGGASALLHSSALSCMIGVPTVTTAGSAKLLTALAAAHG